MPSAVAVGSDGAIYIVDTGNRRLRVVTTDGIINTLAGNGTLGSAGDGGPASAAEVEWSVYDKGVAIGPDGIPYLNDHDRIRRVAPPLPGFSASQVVLASEDGGELYVFDATRRHLRTVDTLTSNVLYQFGYNAAGALITVTDLDGDVTTIERDANGNATAIVGPFGARTTLGAPDANGYLSSIANPAGETVQLTYSTNGLLQTLTDPRQHLHQFHYDDLGRLLRDEDPVGGFTALSRTDTEFGHEITETDALNVTSHYREEILPDASRLRTTIGADGGTNISLTASDGGTTNWLADGTVTLMHEGPDPRFGMQSPIPASVTILTPGGLISSSTASESVNLANPNDPLSVVSQTNTVSLNGKPFTSVYSFDGANRTVTTVSPLQRTFVSVLDGKGRVLQSAVPQIAPVNYQYDNHGRLLTVSQTANNQTRTLTYTYDQTQNGGASSGRLTAITDSLNRTNSFTYDPNLSGRVIRQTFPNGRFIEFQYDANGNLTGVTPPQKPVHLFDFNAVDLLSSYSPPLATNTGNNFTTYAYNLNRQLTNVTRPDGLQINFVYEPLIGRLDHIDLPFNERINYTYVASSCGCSGAGRPSDVIFSAVDYTNSIHYAYDGSLVTGVTWSGPVAGSVNASYDNFFRVNSLAVNGANAVSFGYDNDGLLTQAGALTLARDPQNGRLTGTTLDQVVDGWTYTGFGEAESYTAYAGNILAYFTYFLRDNAGRITNKVEIIGGTTNTFGYKYDPARGWLTDVSSNGVPTAHYEYDDNGNRTYVLATDREVTSVYDDQDRLLHSTLNSQPSTVSYTYTANGELQSKTIGTATTSYSYDVRGALRGVILANGTQIAYVIDAAGRRVGKTVTGILVQGWLYQDALKPIAELDSAGNVVSWFVYAGKANVPEYVVRGGATYRLITDHLGSVRLVVNAVSGAIAQRMDYDEFGRVLADTNPGFQPFGFAGGLYDPDTKLVRFGARDYDADSGRWTNKDPLGEAGGINLYTYVGNNPIDSVDPLGFAEGFMYFRYADKKAVLIRTPDSNPNEAINEAVKTFRAEGGDEAAKNLLMMAIPGPQEIALARLEARLAKIGERCVKLVKAAKAKKRLEQIQKERDALDKLKTLKQKQALDRKAIESTEKGEQNVKKLLRDIENDPSRADDL